MRLAVLAVLAVLSLAACLEQGPVCGRPYMAVGSDCCLDENADGVCDRDKPVCARPYILVGGGCCVDADGNGVCDRDQPPAAETTSSTTLTVTTTTSQPPRSTTTSTTQAPPPRKGRQCYTYDDCVPYEVITCDGDGRVVVDTYGPIACRDGVCIYRGTKDIGFSYCQDFERCVAGVGCVRKEYLNETPPSPRPATTLTTLEPRYDRIIRRVAERDAQIRAALGQTTTTTLQSCVDPDGGRKYDLKSANVTGYYSYNRTRLLDAEEHCVDAQRLLEFYCVSGNLESEVEECDGRCTDGRCCAGEGNLCSNDRECCEGGCRYVGLTYHCVS
jgi:hypothetical protein